MRFPLDHFRTLVSWRVLGGLTLGLLALWGLSSISGGTQAQNTPARIGVIDVQKVLTTSNPGKASFARLKQMQDERIARARVMETEANNLNTQISKPTTTAAQRETLGRQLGEKQVAMKRFAEDAEREMNQARDRELLAMDQKLQTIVQELGKEMAMAAIFKKFESGLVYAADSIDVTDAVIRKFNAGAPAQPAARPAP